ncbi:hypothetical protein MIMGU_mgv11b023931mg [Erythranthe guttata]|uniref:Uncharacterized protein n=1 Tax=Erythranthe guttata TaxID=4155 RepID=A0A022QML5_ERYGU|nr:hypothetical protein MIMGU_mgv11b023931mg [Erythranthe guttata]
MQSVDTVSRQNSIISVAAVNDEGGDNGSLWFWDWESGRNLQEAKTVVQLGLLDCEAGIYSVPFDSTHVLD